MAQQSTTLSTVQAVPLSQVWQVVKQGDHKRTGSCTPASGVWPLL